MYKALRVKNNRFLPRVLFRNCTLNQNFLQAINSLKPRYIKGLGDLFDLVKVLVGAINAKQLQVVFSKAIDKTAAENGSNYVITNAAGSSVALVTDDSANDVYDAKLQSDNKTVILTFNSAITTTSKQTYVSLVINNMQEKDDTTKVMAQYATTVTVHDKTKPAVTKVTSETKGATASSVKIEFSEPVVSASYKLNGSTKAAALAVNGKSATISNLTLDPAVAHTLLITNLTDTNNNTADQISMSFNVVKDTSAPTVTVTTEGDNKIVLQFNKKMDVATVEDNDMDNGTDDFIKVWNASLTTDFNGDITTYPSDSSKTKFLIRTDEALYATKNSVTAVVSFTDNVKDSLGNKMSAQTVNVTLTKDTVKPTVSSATFTKDSSGVVTNIVLNFNERLDDIGAGAATTNVKVTNSTGVDVSTDWLAANSSAVSLGAKKVTFPLHTNNDSLKNGTYTFHFPAGLFTDDSITANTNDAFNITLDFGTASGTFKCFWQVKNIAFRKFKYVAPLFPNLAING